MKTEALHIGMKVEHPHHGIGVVKALSEQSADILFDGGLRTVSPEISHLEPAEPVVTINGEETSLARFIEQIIEQTTHRVVCELGIEKPECIVDQLGGRWNNGRMALHPADPSLQAKEVPLETFFHKIVMIRNNLRVLEQKINSHEKLSDGDKVEMQQYISRCYGSLTTFNILFKNREDQFIPK
ncbi:MAG: hypothetical protein EHM36_02580 [Deltaproteobacteria bacterium]|nr:MAG: hypothetical protein EHM36_02580 [Deltaproteobacteria bacterium]